VIAEFSREKYLGPWARVRRPKKISGDPKLGQELWTWLEEQVKDL
jgi:retinol dehydrogenase 12